MNKSQIFALVLIGLTVVVLLMTRGSASVNLVFATISRTASFVYLGFVAVGVVIGMLLK